MNQSDFLTALGWAVVNSIWQFALLWIIYQVFIAFRPRTQASTRSALASGILLAGFAWFVFTFVSLFGENTAIADSVPYLYGPAGWNHWIADALPVASIVYLLLLTIPVVRFIRNYRYVQLIRTQALHKADVQWRMFVQKLSGQMGIRKKVELWVSDLVHSPVTIGYLRPVILLPVAAVNHLSTDQVEAVLLHELAHIRRFDYLLNLVVRVIQSILYFNPFVKAFVRIIETEREKSCDEMVMQFQYDAHGYASALLTIEKATGVKPQTLAVAAAGTHKHELLGRVENILGIRRNNGMTGMRLAGIMLALSCMAIMHLVLQWKKPEKAGNTDNYLAYLSSPHLLYSGQGNAPASEFHTAGSIETIAANDNSEQTGATEEIHEDDVPGELMEHVADNDNSDHGITPNLLHYISNRENILNSEQEAEVKKALETSTRVLSEVQWKTVEKSIADALSTAEKEMVREQLKLEASKADMTKMESQLKQAYAEINWPALNAGLETAMSQIRLDSLQYAYSNALAGLAELERELANSNAKSIPDSDVSLKNIANKRAMLETLLRKVKATKERKIIKL